MQPRPSSRLFITLAVLAGLAVLIYLAAGLASSVPVPPASPAAAPATSSAAVPAAPASSTPPVAAVPGPSPAISSIVPPASSSFLPPPYSVLLIHAPAGIIQALVASTSAEQELGLGERASLPAREGMLFPFEVPGDYGFWMKDMHFPLDMVWISSDEKVAGVTTDIPAGSYPTVFFPPTPISYVLELNADQAARFGIATGTQLVF